MKLVILDRDGVINADSDNYIKTVEEFILLPGSVEAIAALNNAGLQVVIATNQSGIARGFYTAETLHAMHDKLNKALQQVGGHIDQIYYCPHGPDDHCSCRKPKPGMLEKALNQCKVSNDEAIMIGDSVRDLQSAEAAGVKPILIKTGKGQGSISKMAEQGIFQQVPVYENLTKAVEAIIS